MAQDGIVDLMGEKIREISISEFFEKNRHLLGYENPTKSLLTVVKEMVDNSIDAALEAGILPTIKVSVKSDSENVFRIRVEDNGPGLPPDKIPFAFGKFLVGSKFYRLRQSVGTQGIGAKGAILYAQLTTGKPAIISTFYKGKRYDIEMTIDVLKNEPKVISTNFKNIDGNKHGLIMDLTVEGRYIEKGQSIPTYLRYIWLANPFIEIIYEDPNNNVIKLERLTNELPPLPKEIKPHPYGVELGRFKRMLQLSTGKTVLSFLTKEFSRVGKNNAIKACKLARISIDKKCEELSEKEIEKLYRALQSLKLKAPPTDCLSPLKNEFIEQSLKKEFNAEFVVAVTRKPSVYRGNPFQVQAAIAYGGNLINTIGNENPSILIRFANHTPLLYNQHDCVITRAVEEIDWRNYKISQQKGFPVAPMVIFVDLISVWIPYKSEGKQAIAEYPEILKEIKLALQEAGRKLGLYLSKKIRLQEARQRRGIFEAYSKVFSEYLSNIVNKDEKIIFEKVIKLIEEGKYKEVEEKKEETKEIVEEIKV
ncbi:MAG: DNA topoisomerase VI subunit B [Candidatus Aenigmatarchaeota archaeon]